MTVTDPVRVAIALALSTAVALVMGAPPGASALLTLGLWLVLMGALCVAFERRLEGLARPWFAPAAVLGGLGLGFASLLARDGALLASPYLGAHESFLGVPNHMAFVALAAASLRLRVAPHDGRARSVWMGATLWGAASLLMPAYTATAGGLPISEMLRSAGWPAVVLVLATGLGMARALPWLTPLSHRGIERAAHGVVVVPGLLGLAHLAGLAGNGATAGTWAAGLTLGLTLVLMPLLGARLLGRAGGPMGGHEGVRTLERGFVVATLGIFCLLKTHGMGASNTDENIYFYMAAQLGDGIWPYTDYFFAHPPLHVVLPGLLFAVTGFGLSLAKAIAPAACAITGLALWSMARHHLGGLAAAVAMVAFLFGAEVLKASTNMTGINLTVMWLVLGLRSWSLVQPRRAGLFFACSLSTGIYAAAAVCAALALAVFRSRRTAAELLLTTALGFGAVNLVGWLAAPEAFLDGVYRYHGLKTADAQGYAPLFGGALNPVSALVHDLGLLVGARTLAKEFFYHPHLWLAGLMVPAAALMQCAVSDGAKRELRDLLPDRLWSSGRRGMAVLFWWVTVALFIQFALFRELYSFYFALIYPFLALCLGWIAASAYGLVTSAVTRSWPVRRAVLRLTAGTLLLATLLSWETLGFRAQATAFPREISEAGSRNEYTWKEAPVLGALSPIVETLFWSDHRVRGRMERGYRHYLWNKKRALATLPEVAAYVRDHSAPTDTVAGSSTVAPLVALAAERRLAANEADTNSKRFRTGILDEAQYWEAICQDSLRFLIATPRSFFTARRMGNHATVRRWFRPVKRFEDHQIRYGGIYPITLYERIQPAPIDGRVCQWEPSIP
jgi:hypothetical protein